MKTYFETLEARGSSSDTVDSFPAADGGVKITERKARMWLDSGEILCRNSRRLRRVRRSTPPLARPNAALSRTLTGDELARVRFFSDTFALTEGLVQLYNLKKANAPAATRQQALDATAALWNNNLRLNFATLYETGASSAGGMAFTGVCTATSSPMW